MGNRKPAVWTVPHPEGGWGNRTEGNERFSNRAPTKEAAQEEGREMARERGTEHIVQRRDGTIGERNSYGGDPFPPKG